MYNIGVALSFLKCFGHAHARTRSCQVGHQLLHSVCRRPPGLDLVVFDFAAWIGSRLQQDRQRFVRSHLYLSRCVPLGLPINLSYQQAWILGPEGPGLYCAVLC